MQEKFFILTGAFGSGKSMLLQHLRTLGVAGIEEPARQILAEQRSIGGSGLPAQDARLFVDLMLSRMIGDYNRMSSPTTPVIFDRGIPDALAYASHFGFDYAPGQKAIQQYRYNPRVFFAPAWEQIYTTDEERTVPFEIASQFGAALRTIYEQSCYTLIELPCVSVKERADFILRSL